MSQQPNWTHEEIEAQIREIQAKAKATTANGDESAGVPLMASGTGVMDSAIYGASDKFADYVTSIAANEEDEDDDDDSGAINSNGNTIMKKARLNVHAAPALLRDVI
jgi:splicing factor 3B subunit 1